MRSDHQEPATGSLAGEAYAAILSRTGPHFSYIGSYRDIDAAVRVPLGFVPRVDIRATNQYAGYVWQLGDGGTWTVGPSVNTVIHWNHQAQLQDRWTSGNFGLSAQALSTRKCRGPKPMNATGPRLPYAGTDVSLSGRVSEWLYLWGLYQWGTAINYTPPAELSPFLGARRGAYGSIMLRPSARLNIDQIVLHEQLDTLPDDRSSGGNMIFHTSISLSSQPSDYKVAHLPRRRRLQPVRLNDALRSGWAGRADIRRAGQVSAEPGDGDVRWFQQALRQPPSRSASSHTRLLRRPARHCRRTADSS